MTTNQQQAAQLSIPLTDEQYALFVHAASLTDLTLSQWAAQHLIDAARYEINNETTLQLDSASFDIYMAALKDPTSAAVNELMARNPQWD
ncbi:hypothetical protein BISA_1560 [Bifidobacterium saguini DSM 23967]|uniref:DUF1778 domain-containing protein n=2 Tax=Bifidobacterium saguini TaxID=762210 RepID=A0A087DD72_9BIFI|nr:DUF1778 domain-containing protein [Bifidobacterium saguini]KFI93472.1 hypothetical protein BISA_1560 [Bifidobacterium saguini DSM 23967]QTB90660.1 DUF1778 domain-containing protein [Bifidobacterium saguini]